MHQTWRYRQPKQIGEAFSSNSPWARLTITIEWELSTLSMNKFDLLVLHGKWMMYSFVDNGAFFELKYKTREYREIKRRENKEKNERIKKGRKMNCQGFCVNTKDFV